MSEPLSIVIVEEDRDRALRIIDSLRAARDFDIHVISGRSGLAREIAARRPDLVLVDIASPSRDVIEELTPASSPLERSVAMFVDESDGALTRAAIEAGVSTCVVGGLHPEMAGCFRSPRSSRRRPCMNCGASGQEAEVAAALTAVPRIISS